MSDKIQRRAKSPPIPDGMLELDVIKLNGQEVNLNFYLTHEYTDISQAAEELPNLIEWINGQLQIMYEDKLNAEDAYKRARAEAYFALKNESFATIYGGKPTEKSMEHAINLDEGVGAAARLLNSLAAWCRRLDNIQNSLQTKLDLIRSSEATRRRLVDPAELQLDREMARQRERDRE